VPAAPDADGPKYFCLFEENRDATSPGQLHHFEIVYDSVTDRVTYNVDGAEVRRYSNVPFKLGPCTLALGLMSEKDIAPSKGSVSLHGQGAVGKWGNIRVVTRAA
jgi:beta-glucanase (GH16 family)